MPVHTIPNIIIIPQSGVPDQYVQTTWNTVRHILDMVPNQKRYNMIMARNARAVADMWVQMTSKRIRFTSNHVTYHQIEATILSQQLKKLALSQSPINGILLLNDSIYAGNLNYALGYSNNAYSVIANGFNTPFQLNFPEFQHVLRHELGHKFGATELTNRSVSSLIHHNNLGWHCTTPRCVMNIVNSIQDVRNNLGADYCPLCKQAIRKELSR